MERTEENLEIVREIRSDISYMRRHRNLLCGVPILEVGEVCDLLKICDHQLRRYHEQGLLTFFRSSVAICGHGSSPFCRKDGRSQPKETTLKQQLNKL